MNKTERLNLSNMKKINLLFFFIIVISLNGFSQCQDNWAIKAGSDSSETASRIVTDSNGNIYIAGTFKDHTSLDTIALNGYGKNDMFLAKYDAAGNIQWAQYGGGIENERVSGLAIDANNNIYVTGSFRETAYFGASAITSSGSDDIFLISYSPEGELLWPIKIGGTGQDGANGLTTDEDNNIYVSGRLNNSSFLNKYDRNGIQIWSRQDQLNGTRPQNVNSDYNGHLYITGAFFGTVNLGSSVLTSRESDDIFIAKFDTAGNAVWAKQGGGNEWEDYGMDITTDSNGNVFVTGVFQDTAYFETDTLIAEIDLFGTGGRDIFIAKYNADGNLLWVKQSKGTDLATGYGIATDMEGNAYVTGFYAGPAHFDSITLPGTYNTYTADIFVVKYNASGNAVWAESAVNGRGNDITRSICGDIIATGSFSDTSALGPTELISAGKSDIFIWNVCKAEPCTSTNIEENPLIASNYKIYPNPVSNQLFVEYTDVKESLNLTLYNTLGQAVHTASVYGSEGKYTIDMEAYPKGLYMIRFVDKGTLNTTKIIKQ